MTVPHGRSERERCISLLGINAPRKGGDGFCRRGLILPISERATFPKIVVDKRERSLPCCSVAGQGRCLGSSALISAEVGVGPWNVEKLSRTQNIKTPASNPQYILFLFPVYNVPLFDSYSNLACRILICSNYMNVQVVVPLDQLRAVNPSANPRNASDKYIQIVTVSNHEFWFMGFISYEKALKNLREALQFAPCVFHQRSH
ncbi:hypothetical protein BHM03_00043585 [Ensete ventricosum]|nr:hypothetical protein BHM03_00043585 [Ensete ventricosum]